LRQTFFEDFARRYSLTLNDVLCGQGECNFGIVTFLHPRGQYGFIRPHKNAKGEVGPNVYFHVTQVIRGVRFNCLLHQVVCYSAKESSKGPQASNVTPASHPSIRTYLKQIFIQMNRENNVDMLYNRNNEMRNPVHSAGNIFDNFFIPYVQQFQFDAQRAPTITKVVKPVPVAVPVIHQNVQPSAPAPSEAPSVTLSQRGPPIIFNQQGASTIFNQQGASTIFNQQGASNEHTPQVVLRNREQARNVRPANKKRVLKRTTLDPNDKRFGPNFEVLRNREQARNVRPANKNRVLKRTTLNPNAKSFGSNFATRTFPTKQAYMAAPATLSAKQRESQLPSSTPPIPKRIPRNQSTLNVSSNVSPAVASNDMLPQSVGSVTSTIPPTANRHCNSIPVTVHQSRAESIRSSIPHFKGMPSGACYLPAEPRIAETNIAELTRSAKSSRSSKSSSLPSVRSFQAATARPPVEVSTPPAMGQKNPVVKKLVEQLLEKKRELEDTEEQVIHELLLQQIEKPKFFKKFLKLYDEKSRQITELKKSMMLSKLSPASKANMEKLKYVQYNSILGKVMQEMVSPPGKITKSDFSMNPGEIEDWMYGLFQRGANNAFPESRRLQRDRTTCTKEHGYQVRPPQSKSCARRIDYSNYSGYDCKDETRNFIDEPLPEPLPSKNYWSDKVHKSMYYQHRENYDPFNNFNAQVNPIQFEAQRPPRMNERIPTVYESIPCSYKSPENYDIHKGYF